MLLEGLRDLSAEPIGSLSSTLAPNTMDAVGWSLSVVSGATQAASAVLGLSGVGRLMGSLGDSSEFQNQLHGMECFAAPTRYAPVRSGDTLSDWMARIDRLPFDDRPWVAEGAAYAAAHHAFRNGPGRGFLKVAFPQWCLTVLHTGLGMALAEKVLAGVSGEEELAKAISAFCTLCLANSKVGYEGCALECLGLVARHLHAGKVSIMDALLRQSSPDLRDYFWHGYGRGMYFVPSNLTPWAGAGARTFEMAAAQAPDDRSRLNASSGAAWAFTLVNLRTPKVMAARLENRALNDNPAFTNGVRSALTVWRELQEDDPAYSSLCALLPGQARPTGSRFDPTGKVFRYHA